MFFSSNFKRPPGQTSSLLCSFFSHTSHFVHSTLFVGAPCLHLMLMLTFLTSTTRRATSTSPHQCAWEACRVLLLGLLFWTLLRGSSRSRKHSTPTSKDTLPWKKTRTTVLLPTSQKLSGKTWGQKRTRRRRQRQRRSNHTQRHNKYNLRLPQRQQQQQLQQQQQQQQRTTQPTPTPRQSGQPDRTPKEPKSRPCKKSLPTPLQPRRRKNESGNPNSLTLRAPRCDQRHDDDLSLTRKRLKNESGRRRRRRRRSSRGAGRCRRGACSVHCVVARRTITQTRAQQQPKPPLPQHSRNRRAQLCARRVVFNARPTPNQLLLLPKRRRRISRRRRLKRLSANWRASASDRRSTCNVHCTAQDRHQSWVRLRRSLPSPRVLHCDPRESALPQGRKPPRNSSGRRRRRRRRSSRGAGSCRREACSVHCAAPPALAPLHPCRRPS